MGEGVPASPRIEIATWQLITGAHTRIYRHKSRAGCAPPSLAEILCKYLNLYALHGANYVNRSGNAPFSPFDGGGRARRIGRHADERADALR